MPKKEDFMSGDTLHIVTKEKKEYTGVLLPRNQMLDQNIMVLKLDSGYNIGIQKDRIQTITCTEKYQEPKAKKVTETQDDNLPTVAVLSCGGTISSKIDYRTGGVSADYDAHDFLEMLPELKVVANIHAKKITGIMSEDATMQDWQHIAKEVKPYLDDETIKGIVLTHGTDTMHYTASALSFMLQDINKPIIITGSQRSIDRGSSDAFENLLCSIHAAANWDGATVAICMHKKSDDGACILSRGTKVRKMHTSRRDAFRPINEQALAHITTDGTITVINNNYPTRNTNKPVLKEKLDTHIGLVYIHPSMNPKEIEFFIKEKYKGLIIATTALGHVPNILYDVLEKANKHMIVVNVSQTLYGRAHPYVYSNLRELSVKRGILFLDDMLPETAFTKLAWVLGNTKTKEEARALLQQNIAGEFAGEIDEKSFLN